MNCSDSYGIASMLPSSASSTNYHFNSTVEQGFPAEIGSMVAISTSDDEDLLCEQLLSHNQLTPIGLHQSEVHYDNFSSLPNSFSSSHSENFLPNPIQVKRNIRPPNWTCPECRRHFDNSEQFKAHFEPCWTYAVERELLQQPVNSFGPDAPTESTTFSWHPYHLSVDGEEIHFDGRPALLKSKSGAISLFVSLESQLKAKTDSFNGKAKKAPSQNYFDTNCSATNFGSKSNNPFGNKAIPAQSLLEKVECPVCGKRLYRHNLHVHHRIHTGELPFPCVFCPKRFRTSTARRVHHRSHTGEKPYLCTFCHYACTTKRNLERHVHNRHMSIHSIVRNRRNVKRNIDESKSNDKLLY